MASAALLAETTALPLKRPSVYSADRMERSMPAIADLPVELLGQMNQRVRAEGRAFLAGVPSAAVSLVFYDPQYRGVLDYQDYGNEGSRQKARADLDQMTHDDIRQFLAEIERILVPHGHLMLWVDKFHVAEGISPWLAGLELRVVDMITWDKCKIGMGYRTRRRCEYMMVIQRLPKRAKGIWTLHDIPDVWAEKLVGVKHAHAKPVGLQARLIEAVTAPGDLVVDPAAGSFSVMDAALSVGRTFLGCDIRG